MKKNTWTQNEISFLKENFSTKGMNYCYNILGYSKSKISRMAHILQLKINKDVKEKYKGKPNEKCNINPELFYKISTPEMAYFLGLLWSDGFLNKTKNSYNIGIKINKNDMLQLKKTFNEIGKWNFFEQKNKEKTWTDIMSAVTNNKRIYDFLTQNDYDKKSFVTPSKILSRIPLLLHPYFFRGIIDGDGCFYYGKTKTSVSRQFNLSSTYEQDWSYIINLCKMLDVSFSIQRIKRICSSYSCFRITNKIGIEKIGQYVYQNFENDNIGLWRKYQKYKIIINSPFTHTKFKKYNQLS